METYQSPAIALPVIDDVDVLVVGGGPAGIAAAFAVARAGMRVMVIEQFNCLGGIATAGGHAHINIYSEWQTDVRVVGGISHEIGRRLAAEGHGHIGAYGVWFEVEGLKFLLDRMARELNIRVRYYTQFCQVVMDGRQVTGAVIQSKSGRQVVLARRIVDCTGDGDVAASAGAPFEQGRPGDGKCQPVTLMFTAGGIDWNQVCPQWKDMNAIFAEAQRNGDMETFQTRIMGLWWTPTCPTQLGINVTHVTNIDGTNADDLTAATIEARRQAFHMIDVFRKYVRGMESCFLSSTPNTVGVRETRRILGEVVLTEQDMQARRAWEDAIGYGAFYIDIHNLDGPGMSGSTWNPEPGFRYQIPYRILVPRAIDNLLVAGRCVSVTHVALGSIRVMAQCMVTGEAAGTAAALSLQAGVAPRVIDVPTLQQYLRTHDVILSEDDIARANAQ